MRPNGYEEKANRCAVCKDPRIYDSLDWIEAGEELVDGKPVGVLHRVHYCREHWQIVIKLFKAEHTSIATAVPDMQKRTKELYRRLQDGDALEV